MSARRAARAAAARPVVTDRPSFDFRDPVYGIERWPPAPGSPVPLSVICEARRAARAARMKWELEQNENGQS